jgi:alkylation response protein AidB-like acyl-CoA dehydrogenase
MHTATRHSGENKLSTAVPVPGEDLLPAVEDFVAKRVAPMAETIDREARFIPELLDEAAELGLQSLLFDRDLELNLSRMSLVHEVTEIIASKSAAVAMQLGGARLVAYLLARYANAEVREQWLVPTLQNRVYGSFALTEPHAGTDVRGITTVARRKADHFVLSGEKCWVGFAPVAAYALVLAKLESTDRDAPTVALAVDMSSKGATGRPGPRLSAMRGLPNGILRFDDVKVSATNALNVEGFTGMMDGLNMARIDASSYACGLLRGALEASLGRAVSRTAFGVRIGDMPSIQIKLGRMRAAYCAARELALRAGESFALGGGGDQDVISIAKMTASDLARRHTDEAMQVYAASGLPEYSHVERMHRDAKATQIFDGTSEIHETMLGRRLVRTYSSGGQAKLATAAGTAIAAGA